MNNILVRKLTLKKHVVNTRPPTPISDPPPSPPPKFVSRIPINKFFFPKRTYRAPPQVEEEQPPVEEEQYYEEQPSEEPIIEQVQELLRIISCSSGLVPDLILNTDTFISPINISVNSQSSTYLLEIFISSNGYSVTNPGEIYLTFAASQNNSMNIDNSYNLGYYINQLSETKNNNSFITMVNNSSTINYHLVNSGVNTTDFITTSRIIFTPEILGELCISPVVTMTNNLPSTLYYNFNIVQLK